jgi:hypothetical protein
MPVHSTMGYFFAPINTLYLNVFYHPEVYGIILVAKLDFCGNLDATALIR